MPANRTTRRSLLTSTAIGTATIIASGAAGASASRNRRLPRIARENDVTFVFFDCSHVRLAGEFTEETQVELGIEYEGPGGPPTLDTWFLEVENDTFDIDVADEHPADDPILSAAAVHEDFQTVASISNPHRNACAPWY